MPGVPKKALSEWMRAFDRIPAGSYSHSMVPGGFAVMS